MKKINNTQLGISIEIYHQKIEWYITLAEEMRRVYFTTINKNNIKKM